MNTSKYHEWFNTKLGIADQIVADFKKTGVEDAGILLCCTASAFAAQMWPGERIDRVRFVQYLVEFSCPDLQLSLVSVPVLQEKLRDSGEIDKSNALEDNFYPKAGLRLLDVEDVDQPESQILALIPALSLRDIRLCSYASIIYSEFRSGLVHEYSLSPYLSSMPGKDHPYKPSYMNWLVEPEPEAIENLAEELGINPEDVKATHVRIMRRLHLPYGFLRSIITSTSLNALAFWEAAASWRRARPEKWWLDGGSL